MANTYSNKPVLSKLKIGANMYYLKDAEVRSIIDGYNNDIVTGSIGLVTGTNVFVKSENIKAYVDAQVGAINKFDVQVVETLPTPSKDTMYILYLLAEDGKVSGTYVEYITVRSGAGTDEDPYTYTMEKIGTTAVDLTNYLKNTATVAGVAFGEGQAITKEALQEALELGKLAYKDSASGTVAGQTITGVKATYTPEGSVAVGHTPTAATVTPSTGAYTPAGDVTGTVVAAGSIDVTVKDADETTAAGLVKADYTPEGSIAINAINVATAAAMTKADDGVQISGTVSKPSITITPTTKTVLKDIKTAATLPTFTEGAFTPASITTKPTGTFATEGLTAEIAEDDEECLVFSAAGTGSAVTDVTIDGGSKAADTFTAGAAAEFNTETVLTDAAAALDAAPEFTGDKFNINLTTSEQALTGSFTGTKVENALVTGVNYYKQVIDTAEFTGASANINAKFAGTEASVLTGVAVTYDKANAAATFTGTEGEAAVGDITVTAKNVTVE